MITISVSGYFFSLSAQETINCKNDLAIVRLYLNNPKKIHLQNALRQAKNDKEAVYFENELTKHNKERLFYTMNVITNFRKYYRLQDHLRFVPDSLWSEFKAGKIRNYFLNNDGSLDDQTTDPSQLSYYVIARGAFDEDFYAIDKTGNTPALPFPDRLKHTLITKLGAVFSDAMKSSVERYCFQINKYCNSN